MTDARTTQLVVEEWAGGNPAAQVSQIVVEQWGSAAVTSARAVVSQLAVEQWAVVAAASSTQARAGIMA